MSSARGLQALAIAALLAAAVVMSGCGASMPHRTGYDRRTGTWKPVPGSKARKAVPKTISPATVDSETTSGDVVDSGAPIGLKFRGQASYYGREFDGRPTASGEIFDPDALTCAHRTLPFGTRLRVVYPKRGLSTTVKVNDRGPFKDGRVLDLSRAAADDLGMTADGVGTVEAEVVP